MKKLKFRWLKSYHLIIIIISSDYHYHIMVLNKFDPNTLVKSEFWYLDFGDPSFHCKMNLTPHYINSAHFKKILLMAKVLDHYRDLALEKIDNLSTSLILDVSDEQVEQGEKIKPLVTKALPSTSVPFTISKKIIDFDKITL